jgi:hypothetical protein
LIGGGWRSSVEYITRLRSVTPAVIQRVSQKYMRNIRFVVLGDPKAINSSVFTGFEESLVGGRRGRGESQIIFHLSLVIFHFPFSAFFALVSSVQGPNENEK